MKRRTSTLFFGLSLATVLCACSFNSAGAPVSGPPLGTPSGAVAAQTPPANGSVTASPSAAAGPLSQVSPTPVGQAIAYPDPHGLDSLDSYSLVLRFSFKGMRDGQSIETTDVYSRTFSRDPAAQFTTVQTTDQDDQPIQLLYGSIGQAQYAQGGANSPCTVRWSDAATAGNDLNPVELLTPVRRGKEAGLETVNGIPARHYALDASSFDSGRPADISGDIWIAEPGNFVVKYVLHTQGDETYFGKGVQGEQTTDFELMDIGVKQEIVPPVGCPPPFSDLPATADATNLVRTPWGLSYGTASGLDQTVAFYTAQMKTLGWVLEANSGAAPTRSFLAFALPSKKEHAYIKLTVAGAKVQVDVLVTTE